MVEESRGGGLYPALLRFWRSRRGMSQLDLAGAADVSSRHISFLETGRSAPSAAMVLRLATVLDVPLSQANLMLRACGYENHYRETDSGTALAPSVRAALDLMQQHHEPFPLFVLNEAYDVLQVNAGAGRLLMTLLATAPAGALDGAADDAIDPSGVNLARFVFSPLGPVVIENHPQVARELYWRMRRHLLARPDLDRLRALVEEISDGEGFDADWRNFDLGVPGEPTLPLRLRVEGQTWTFLLMVSGLQSPLDVSLENLQIETWFPVDELTAQGCERLAASGS